MKYLSVCAGIEAATVAWHDLGWEPVLFSEIDAFPRKVLAHRQNAVDARKTGAAKHGIPLWGDFTAIRPRFLKRLGIDGTIELVVGGTPCQDFSVAGKRAGLDGARGNLTLEYAHLLRRTKPRWFVWENVPGAFSLNKGKDFGAVLARFAGHAPGSGFAVPREGWRNSGIVPPAGPGCYGLAWRVLDAQYVRVDSAPNAVPQRRRRVFVIGYLGDWRPAAAVLLEQESLHGDTPPRREPGQIPAPTLSARSKAGGGLGTDFDLDGGLIAEPLVAHTLKGEGFDASEDGTGRGVPLVAGALCRDSFVGGAGGRPDGAAAGHFVVHAKNDNTPLAFDCKASGRNGFSVGEIAPTLRAMGSLHSHQNAGGHVAVFDPNQITSKTNRSQPTPGLCHTLPATPNSPIAYSAIDHIAPRRLTPLECDRLQNFPDNYTLIPMKRRRPISFDDAKYYWRQAEPGIKCWCENGKWYTNAAPDGPRYKALGNSMATNVMRWIGKRIDMVEQIINAQAAA